MSSESENEPTLAHLAGSMKDDPTWDDFIEIMAENRRKDQELFNEQLDLEEAAEEIAQGNKFRWQIIKPERWELADLIGCLCSRPTMFFRNGSFSEGAAYIDGFVSGRGGSVAEEFNHFRRWLAERAYEANGAAQNLVWLSYIEQLFPNDAEVFANLPGLFALFLLEQTPTETSPDVQIFAGSAPSKPSISR